MDEEQRQKLVGFGAAKADALYERGKLVLRLLEWGSPQLAYGVACGYGLAPLKIPITGEFPDSLTVNIPQATNQDKVVQDTLVDRISWHLDNLNTPTSVFDSQADYFFARQSGIEAQFNVVGAPRYPIANRFTPVTEIAGDTEGWILQLTNGQTVQFRATFPLPDVPMRATLVLHTRTVRWDRLYLMDEERYIRGLEELGYDCTGFKERYKLPVAPLRL